MAEQVVDVDPAGGLGIPQPGDRVITGAEVAEMARVNNLRPKEEQFIGKPGYRRRYRADGSYTWRYRYRPNVDGKITREGAEVLELLRPFQQADAERHVRNTAGKPQARLKDRDGNVHFVDPALAGEAARRNGWCHHWRVGGTTVERGFDGMLFRRTPSGWEPTGRTCLGTPIFGGSGKAPTDGLQRDPGGDLWEFVCGRWVRLTGD